MVEFKDSHTKINLMRAFAGESQARNRYTFAETIANSQKLNGLGYVFKYTASQELAHANVFYGYLKDVNGENIEIDAGYPVDNYNDIGEILKTSHHNEYEEYESAYPAFAKTAKEEGFSDISKTFEEISKIEQHHGDRFNYFYELYKNDKLFKSDTEIEWICLNCGYIYEGKEPPKVCPVCKHPQGYYVPLELAPWDKIK